MPKINNMEIILDIFNRWKPNDLAFIVNLSYTSNSQDQGSIIVIESIFQARDSTVKQWPSNEARFYNVKLQFSGVTDLQLNSFGTGPVQIMGFDIIDISHNKWENINFEIEDYEDGKIHFYCSEISIVSVTANDDFKIVT